MPAATASRAYPTGVQRLSYGGESSGTGLLDRTHYRQEIGCEPVGSLHSAAERSRMSWVRAVAKLSSVEWPGGTPSEGSCYPAVIFAVRITFANRSVSLAINEPKSVGD